MANKRTCEQRGYHSLKEPIHYEKDGIERHRQECKDCPKVYDEPKGVPFKWTAGR